MGGSKQAAHRILFFALGCLVLALTLLIAGGLELRPYLGLKEATEKCTVTNIDTLKRVVTVKEEQAVTENGTTSTTTNERGKKTDYQGRAKVRYKIASGETKENYAYRTSPPSYSDTDTEANYTTKYEVGKQYTCVYREADQNEVFLQDTIGTKEAGATSELVFGGVMLVVTLVFAILAILRYVM